ncbi:MULTISPECIES: TetR/AcrR family transcriptional regulator [unclassified Sphingopyxis]|uniref:TetR/AcrR family transcriptional regulator n=1 Tax=unclassified Sphingopyxis TaxID=2614943 RepID=UPI00073707CB|nr:MULTISPECIES: TetR/AcrR family transcriptional regulator [unclassified Sphingopyxis]KTE18748.1 hypothetical protein ATE67_16755 [Sphingopyxis sp. H050]KTE39515.1 hypothetical protein ATE62_08900 [Sphingopyxis sp. HIX]KTE84350.1 hypothetical protein ATE72_09075 [Sphingopyxis sp. HXXIV]
MQLARAKTPRVRRVDSQAATRARLLDLAEQMVVSQSIPGLSLRSLCVAAGYTQGAFYSNFASKDALLLVLLERHMGEQHASLASVAEAVAGSSVEGTLDALTVWLRTLAAQREWAALATELRLHANRDALFGEKFEEAEQRMVALFEALLADLAKRFSIDPPVAARGAAEALLDLWRGLALRRQTAAAPELTFVRTLRALMGLADGCIEAEGASADTASAEVATLQGQRREGRV